MSDVMDYLIYYGWGLLVIVVVGAALYSMGPLPQRPTTPELTNVFQCGVDAFKADMTEPEQIAEAMRILEECNMKCTVSDNILSCIQVLS